ncbi:uncharacterized protein LOC116852632 [Odontomachus brunneus]|uniref:uncharacterized protein LOC116852632 n=1 Tax=Odontomachus brunneus TaxID=486640 RepID=UPI0013F1C212|nr:uncharacterized protein LOC116852632 [Odontomachus brunneus]XP_032689069.1 uncharacterized protein LOC116852632 [Odontomachus brunneus]
MVSQAENRRLISEDEATLELRRLQEAVKLAAIYHNGEGKFHKRTDLSHIVHVSLHGAQFICILATEIFHYVHHYVNKRAREKDDTIPALPEERNPIFFLYPICMLVSLILAILWLVKKILPDRPVIPFVLCATGAILMLVTGIMEMKHVDIYIDITEISDEELLEHPVFIHNFVMCILSIFIMTLYLLQTWVLFDYWQWLRGEQDLSTTTDDTQSSDSSVVTDVTESTVFEKRIDERESRRQVVELAPIPTFEDLSTPAVAADSVDMDEEPILYCCFVDWYNYIRIKIERKPKHEFQVVHIM